MIKRYISEETKKKISESHKGKIHSDKTKRKMSEIRKEKYRSEEFKLKMSESHKGIAPWNKGKTGLKPTFLGKHHTEEAKRKISEKQKGKIVKPFSIEHRRKMSESKKGERIPRIETLCATCQKKIFRLPSKLKKDRNFCSYKCQGIWAKKNMKQRDTSIEIIIENTLKKQNIPYLKQVPILGIAIVDFLLSNRIIVQCDGDYWHKNRKDKDIAQDVLLNFKGYTVIRLTEKEINTSINKCLKKIANALTVVP